MTPVCSDEKVSRKLRICSDSDDLKEVIHSRVLEPALKSFKLEHHFLLEHTHILSTIFSFIISNELEIPASFFKIAQVCQRWRAIYDNIPQIWKRVETINSAGCVNWNKFRNEGKKNEGTEGILFKVTNRSDGKAYAMKRARVYPQGEGVPYYMIRELAVLKGMAHPNIASMVQLNLKNHRLHVFFEFIPHTLHDCLNPANDTKKGRALPEKIAKRLLKQLLEAVAYCHRRGVLHRNLKPKHLLIDGVNPSELGEDFKGDGPNLEKAVLKLTDFALVRLTGYPRRAYTNEVVTLWYRPPEILMGVRDYLPAVDMWSVGCIFAEMVLGRPLFTGVSEVDQLFQIFSKLSTPNETTWPEFSTLPNVNFKFPNWVQNDISRLFPTLGCLGVDLIGRLLSYDPSRRITASQALLHPFFEDRDVKCICSLAVEPSINACTGAVQQFSSSLSTGRIVNMYEFLENLRDQEASMWPVGDIFQKQTSIRPSHRAMLVDWLVEVVDVFEMSQRTAFLAMVYTDRFMKDTVIERAQYQLIGATCLHIASKCEDVSYIGIDDLAMCADSVFKPADVLSMEEVVLNVLGFTLSIPTILDFVTLFIEILNIDGNTQDTFSFFCKYIAEICMLNHEFSLMRPSLVATSIVIYSLHVFRYSWAQSFPNFSVYKLRELKEVTENIHAWHSMMNTHQLQVIRKRYLKEEVGKVAQVPCPMTLTIVWQ